MVPYRGQVALQTPDGWLVLCNVDQVVSEEKFGSIIRTPVKMEDIPEVAQQHADL